ncbi:hypothetical protein PLICRDRAFT_179488 [Plicaturopsis crispa FD-325 SS-3]|uniref:Uncharacterized protein n=1 Tax=Plicaturopsis crispa FD-325 SS-3 TaxID=944288 RepID=A0A0C9SL13_PLICR|nr:hypothetical protein PLICRDRAFT_179488 [Plicaturopsis crispa FD-325 SS-3]
MQDDATHPLPVHSLDDHAHLRLGTARPTSARASSAPMTTRMTATPRPTCNDGAHAHIRTACARGRIVVAHGHGPPVPSAPTPASTAHAPLPALAAPTPTRVSSTAKAMPAPSAPSSDSAAPTSARPFSAAHVRTRSASAYAHLRKVGTRTGSPHIMQDTPDAHTFLCTPPPHPPCPSATPAYALALYFLPFPAGLPHTVLACPRLASTHPPSSLFAFLALPPPVPCSTVLVICLHL